MQMKEILYELAERIDYVYNKLHLRRNYKQKIIMNVILLCC